MCSKTITLTLSLEFQQRERPPGTGAVWDSLNHAACINSSPLSLHLHPSLLIANLPLKQHLSLLGPEGFSFISAPPALHFQTMLRMHTRNCGFVITANWWCFVMFGHSDSWLCWHKCMVWIKAWSEWKCFVRQNGIFDWLRPIQRESSRAKCPVIPTSVRVRARSDRASVNDVRFLFFTLFH